MIECGTKTYGEEGGERMGMKNLCKSCMIKTATDMGVKRVQLFYKIIKFFFSSSRLFLPAIFDLITTIFFAAAEEKHC